MALRVMAMVWMVRVMSLSHHVAEVRELVVPKHIAFIKLILALFTSYRGELGHVRFLTSLMLSNPTRSIRPM